MPTPFRLALSGSAFIYVMSRELLDAAYMDARTGRAAPFDDRRNRMIQDFVRRQMAAMESCGIPAMECYHATVWDSGPIVDIILAKPGVEVWSVHAPYGMYMDASSGLPEAREGAREAFEDTVRVAARLGAKVVVVHPGVNIPYDLPRRTRMGYVAETIRPVADLAGELGLRLAVEPLPLDEIGRTLDEVLWIVEAIDRPNVGINFDTNHLFPAARIPDLVRQAGSRIVSVHISDQDDQERHWLPFEGSMDWREVLTALAGAGYTGPLVYEAHIRNAGTFEDVCETVLGNYERLIALAPAAKE